LKPTTLKKDKAVNKLEEGFGYGSGSVSGYPAGIKMESRIRIGITTMPIHNTACYNQYGTYMNRELRIID
jgi:hypothetical protein